MLDSFSFWQDNSGFTTASWSYTNNSINMRPGNSFKGLSNFAAKNYLDVSIVQQNPNLVTISMANFDYGSGHIITISTLAHCVAP
jgi:hypothetical protein